VHRRGCRNSGEGDFDDRSRDRTANVSANRKTASSNGVVDTEQRISRRWTTGPGEDGGPNERTTDPRNTGRLPHSEIPFDNRRSIIGFTSASHGRVAKVNRKNSIYENTTAPISVLDRMGKPSRAIPATVWFGFPMPVRWL
jgi:hypothetical protein